MEKEKLDYKKLLDELVPEFEEVVSSLRDELNKIRVSRGNPALFEDLMVEIFGQRFPLKQLATISVNEKREIIIHPWDSSYIDGILKAIEKAGLNLTPIAEQNFIRISIPPITKEFREELLKILPVKKERARKRIREERERVWNIIQTGYREGRLSEDEKYKAKDEIQELIEKYHKEIDALIEKKKKEILE